MRTAASEPPGDDAVRVGTFPAYGPIDALLGYLLFYVLVDRATPTVVDVFTDVVGLPAALVRLGLAALLWVVLLATGLDQARRQLGALGVVNYDGGWLDRCEEGVPTERQSLLYLVGLLLGGLVVSWTAGGAIETAVALIPAIAALDVGAFLGVEFLAMVVFFVAYSVATRSLDRLVVGGLRWARLR